MGSWTTLYVVFIAISLLSQAANSYTQIVRMPHVTTTCIHMTQPPKDDNPSRISPSDQDEAQLESMSRNGAKAIDALSLEERTQRAIMAEAIEDRIFAISEELDSMIVDGMIPHNMRDEAVHLAKESKRLKGQYNDIVSGKPSSVMNSIDGLRKSFR